MKKMQKFRYFALGVLFAFVLSSLTFPALAALSRKTIQVSSGVNLYVDDTKFIPTDVNGNQVEVFLYNGTTYLPARAISEVLGKPIQWEGLTSSVYIGKHSSDTPAVLVQDLDYYTGSNVRTKTSLKDNLGNTHYNVVDGAFDNVYKINGEYTRIAGTLFQQYDYRSITGSIATLQIYGDGKLLYTAEMKGGIDPIDFSVNLTGVLELRISISRGYYLNGAIADFGLYT